MKLWQLGLLITQIWIAGRYVALGRTGWMMFMVIAWGVFTVVMAARDE